jgi:biotin/methionine sulfoxide reductase
LVAGQVVRIFNGRGACLAAVQFSDQIMQGVIQIATGAWFDPDSGTCLNGNPNVLTPDKGTSQLAQGPIAHSCLVEVEAVSENIAHSQIYTPPAIIKSTRDSV